MSGNTTSDIGITEKTYATSEVAKMIGIAPVTVRKYSQLLEDKGYVFIRSQVKSRQKARLYRYKDVETLRYLTSIRKDGHITVDQAVSVTVERLGKGAIQDIASAEPTNSSELELYTKQHTELKEMILDLTSEVAELRKENSEIISRFSQHTENRQLEVTETDGQAQKKKGLLARIFNK